MPDTESSRYVRESTLKDMFDSHATEMKKYIAEHFAVLLEPTNKEIALLRSELKSRDSAISDLKEEVAAVKATNAELANANKELTEKLTKFDKFQSATLESFKQLEEKVEDRTNRQLRKTIVVKGLPEKPNEKWSDTRNLLAKHIAKSYNMEFKTAYAMFERVHRGGGNGYQERKKNRRDIYALCSKWDDSEHLVWKSYEVNKSKAKKDRVIIEYKYGPLTNLRRGEAMKKRKEVMDEKLYRNAYVKFPAVLMGRKDGEDGYSEIANYSDKCVSKLAVFVRE